ncbi:hypothetical protein DPMN_191809 [Dreissena polymorpha]|uniref:Uncharacterized protein n=1 Tax=Dreissena polymorpha TaxID=45954 RepID=A0A9D3XXV7_DREPO|nr:hypothetical protein DPMN_191809 [Dreissena polymorpha]
MKTLHLMCLLVTAVVLLASAPVANAQNYDYGYGGKHYGYPGNSGYGGNYGYHGKHHGRGGKGKYGYGR